jgi:biotin synthase-related radical SAM superfamily protein
MKCREDIEPRDLIEEVERYLATVAVFRAQGCEPIWRPEPDRLSPAPDRAPVRAPRTPSAN